MFRRKIISLNLQSKPGAIDNEAIEELVNRFLNSDAAGDGKEEKLNKEALKLINSSKYWDVNNLEVSSFFLSFFPGTNYWWSSTVGLSGFRKSKHFEILVFDTTQS